MIDLEHCTILGNESIDANSLNRCMFNLHRKMVEASKHTVGSTSENIPAFPFFSGGYENVLTSLGVTSADSDHEGVVARLYSGDLDIYISQDNSSFSTESETGTYYYSAEELSTFAPSVSSLYKDSTPLILRSILTDDESTMVTGVSSLGTASSPTVKFTSYLTCSKSGVSFGTITFTRNNGDHQENTISLNIPRDLIGIEGVESVDFFSIGNGFSSGVRTVTDNLNMVSDIGQCTLTYLSDTDVAISNITKSDNSDYIKVDRETGRIVDSDDDTFGRYIELSNDEVVLNFFALFTLKDDVVKYSDDLWCFYIVDDEEYGKDVLNNANAWARDYFKYSFDNFLAADDGKIMDDGRKVPTVDSGCIVTADDAFNGCYNATFKSLCWISPSLRYADRMFKGCTHASFESLPNILHFDGMRSAVSMFENCIGATFANIESIEMPSASRLTSMFAGCTNATFDKLDNITVKGDASKMFYGDYNSDFLSLTGINGSGTRFISMFEGCNNAEFPLLEKIESVHIGGIDASRMFYGLNVPTFSSIENIELGCVEGSEGYVGVSMFQHCGNATFSNLTSLGNVVDGSYMFFGCDSPTAEASWQNKCTFENLKSVGRNLVYGNSMFQDNRFLTMTVEEEAENLKDGTCMFMNTSTVKFEKDIPSLVDGREMFSLVNTAIVDGDMNNLLDGESMFAFDGNVEVSGDMSNLVNAHNMFTGSDNVYVKSFPGTVEDAINSFSDISSSCKIDRWGAASNNRIADNCFSHSNNVFINGNIIDGRVVSTSHMFDSATSVTIYNEKMAEAAEEEREKSRFFSTESGEKFTYLQRMSSDSLSGKFTLVGNSSYDDLESYILSTFETSSLVIAATLRTKTINYGIYSVGDDGVSILVDDSYSFTEPSSYDTGSLGFSSDYFYAQVDGYTEFATPTSMLAISERKVADTTEYRLYNATGVNGATTDNRKFVLSSLQGDNGYTFEQYADGDAVSPQFSGRIYFSNNEYHVEIDNKPSLTQLVGGTGVKSFFFDFIQLDDDNKTPRLVVGWEDNNGSVNRYAVDDSSITKIGEDSYPKLMILNSKDDINVRIIPIWRYGEEKSEENVYGYLMQYCNSPYSDNRISFCKGNSIPTAMVHCPKGYVGDYTVAQIFSDHRFEDDIPFGANRYGTTTLKSDQTTRLKTHFSIGNADMGGYWKYADNMFHDVVEDSLLSGYFCFSDISLEDTREMFALEEYRENDTTFKDAGPLMQNLARSNVKNMDGMFRNRCVVEPTVFKDLYYEGDNDTYISFQIPQSVESASAAFFNCHISGGDYYNEIGFRMPSTLVMADDMFNGYQGPKIRFGYDSDGYVYVADNFSGERMFDGCEFSNTSSDEKFCMDIPTIYLNMFEGSDFSMNNISSLVVRNGLNFAYPYSNDTFFYNDINLLGCSNISLDSLENDVLDWFCTDTGDVEGVYLATVIGPKNGYDNSVNPPALTADYRLMTAERRDGTWSNPRMADIRQFTPDMVSKLYSSTNNLNLGMSKEFNNRRGRATCMFNPSILFKYTDVTLGDALSSNLGHDRYAERYDELTDDAYVGSTYRQLVFGCLENVNAIEMPFAFAGLSSATFDSLSSIGTSAIMGYGAFMNCTSATFDSLKTISFMQNGLNQPEQFSSRFCEPSNADWYGNYCNMFAGCSSASMSSLENILMNSEYDVYGDDDRALVWFDVNGDLNYTTYSNYDYTFAFSFDATASSDTFKMAVSDYGFDGFFDYDTEVPVSAISSIDVKFKQKTEPFNSVLSIITINSIGGNDSNFYIDTDGNVTNSLFYAINIPIWPYYIVYDENHNIVDKTTQPVAGADYYRLDDDGEYVAVEINPTWPDSKVYVLLNGEYEEVDKSTVPEVGVTYFQKSRFVDDYTVDIAGCNRTYFVMNTISSYGIEPSDEDERKIWEENDISESAKFLMFYMNANEYQSIDVDENMKKNINYGVKFVEASGNYYVNIYDNNIIDYRSLVSTTELSGIQVDDGCRFKMELSEINGAFTPLLIITDAHNDEYIYQILSDGTVERLSQHPKRGVVKELYKESAKRFAEIDPETGNRIYTTTTYSDSYGQSYEIVCSEEEGEYPKYVMKLTGEDGDVAVLSTSIPSSALPENVEFNIGTYLSNGMDCIIVGIKDTVSGDDVFYKIYNDAYFGEYGKRYKYVEETPYNPAIQFTYKHISTIEFGNGVSVAHKAYCSGMFMHQPCATFENLGIINLPAVGSCAGMFSDVFTDRSANTNGQKLMSSLKYMVLPRAERADIDDGYLEYRGILGGVPVSSVDFGNLVETRTNIYALGHGGNKTKGYELFYGMLDDNLVPFDDEFHPMTKDVAVNEMNLSPSIADRMEWGNGLLTLMLDTTESNQEFVIAIRPFEGESVTIDWGDGDREVFDDYPHTSLTKLTHNYLSAGTYRVMVSDTISRFVVGDYDSYDTATMKNRLPDKTDSLVTSVISFGSRMTDVSFAFAACSRLTDICGWNCEYVNDVSYCYYGCANITTSMPKWGTRIENCEYCYYGCSSMTQTFSDSADELMPTFISVFNNCVYGTSRSVRDRFFVDWGGTVERMNPDNEVGA